MSSLLPTQGQMDVQLFQSKSMQQAKTSGSLGEKRVTADRGLVSSSGNIIKIVLGVIAVIGAIVAGIKGLAFLAGGVGQLVTGVGVPTGLLTISYGVACLGLGAGLLVISVHLFRSLSR